MNLFDLFDAPSNQVSRPVANDTWRPEAPPVIQDQTIYLNVEASGLRWFDRDYPISIGLYTNGRTYYLPWKHAGAGNLDENVVKEWARRELRGKKIVNINTRFDVHMLREWGVDLEEQGNTVSDVGHYAALLDDHRLKMSLDSLIYDLLAETPMKRLDESKMVTYSAGAAAPRAMYNVDAVRRLAEELLPRIKAENLERVLALEESIIYPVCEIEKNGSLINVPLLDQWLIDIERKYKESLMNIYRVTGMSVNPNSSTDIAKVFNRYNIPITEYTAPSARFPNGQPSFTEEVLKHEKHPAAVAIRKSKKLKSLKSKLEKYRESIDDKGILRYALHQLRTSKDEGSEDKTGTITGRFTSTEIVKGEGINIQQVLKPEKQLTTFGDEFFIRELHIPEPGDLYYSADAEQIQYRVAAGMAGNPKVIEGYKKDPWHSYHKMVWAIIKKVKPDMTYKRTKDVNFAKLFAAGPTKIAWMLGFITKREFEELSKMKVRRSHPKLKTTMEILQLYKREFPEIDDLIRNSSERAKNYGFVTSLLGRRMRFPDGQRLHKALNMEVQSTEADIVKTKMVEIYKERKRLGLKLRSQVHDEINGDVPNEKMAEEANEILNRQSFDLPIPILWGGKTGTSWGDCAREELEKLRKEMRERGEL